MTFLLKTLVKAGELMPTKSPGIMASLASVGVNGLMIILTNEGITGEIWISVAT